MTKTSLKRYWIVLISACCVSAGVVLACADGYNNEYGTSNFTPEIFVDSTYSPFFYSVQFYYGIGHDENHLTRWKNADILEWTAYLGKTGSWEMVDYLLDSAGASSIDSALTRANARSDKKMTTFLNYLRLAKKCEAFALTPITYAWDRDTTQQKAHFDATVLNRQLEKEMAAATDPFIRSRYWFQLVRSHFFNDSPQDVIHLFNEYQNKFPHSEMYFRCLSYTAGAWYKLKDFSKANYYYSHVFDSCNELRTVAHYSFHPQEEKDWEATLALCRSTEEKTTLWQMLGIFYADPQRAIHEIYQLDPRSEKLDLLLARAVNASEQRFGDIHDEEMPNQPSDSSNRDLQTLVMQISNAGNTARPWIWQLAAGYLNMLDKQYKVADAYYGRAALTVPKDRLPQAQYRLLKMLNTLAAAHIVDGSLENKLLPDIQWLVDNTKKTDFRKDDAFSWLKKTLAAKYRRAGEKIKAECLDHRSAFYADSKNVEALKTFMEKSVKTPFEQMCIGLSTIQRSDLYEFQAIQHGMNGQIEEAIAALKQTPPPSDSLLPANPFNARTNDCHDCDHEAPQKVKYTKMSFLLKLKELKDKITAGQDVYTNAILMGNAQYNITHYGNDRAFYECNIYGVGHSNPTTIDSIFQAPLTSMSMAIKYYTLALNAAANDEQRAKCQYLLAKCQRNDWYNHTIYNDRNYWWGGDRKGPDFVAWDGFKALKQYPGTQYYKEALKECGYFNTYVQKHK